MPPSHPTNLQDLSKLLDQLSRDNGASAQERRRNNRTVARARIPLSIGLPDGGPPVPATLRDLSPNGIGIVLPIPLERGTLFSFHASTTPKPLQGTCRAANCRPTADGSYIIGGQMIQITRSQPSTPPAPSTSPPSNCRPADPAADVDPTHLSEVRDRLSSILDPSR